MTHDIKSPVAIANLGVGDFTNATESETKNKAAMNITAGVYFGNMTVRTQFKRPRRIMLSISRSDNAPPDGYKVPCKKYRIYTIMVKYHTFDDDSLNDSMTISSALQRFSL